MKYWGKDREGNIFEKCLRCGSNSKKHFARGRCHTCYHKWLADNNPEYREKLRIKDRLKEKRRRQTEKYKIKEREKDRIKRAKTTEAAQQKWHREVRELRREYIAVDRLIESEKKFINQQVLQEKQKDIVVFQKVKKWLLLEGGYYDLFDLPKLELLRMPFTTVKYFKGWPLEDDFVLNLKTKFDLSFSLKDLVTPISTLMYKGTKFTKKHEESILKRADQKILIWEIKNKKRFLKYAADLAETEIFYSTGLTKEEFELYREDIIDRYKPEIRREYDRDPYKDWSWHGWHLTDGVCSTSEFDENGVIPTKYSYTKSLEGKEKIYAFIKILGFSLYVFSPIIRKLLLDLIRESENEIRFEMGVPAIGEGWVSETSLFHQVKELCEKNGEKAIHHARPEWLGKQHLDIFIPGLDLAIEYQGKQHNTPVGFFGGEEAHVKTLERDKKKKELCEQNNIELIYVNEGDDTSALIKDLKSRI